jgi:hypothetical protein
MINEQFKISNNFGNDTHVRDQSNNTFAPAGFRSFQMVAGEILTSQLEPIFKQNYVTVKMTRGGQASAVPWPGAFIDPITGNLHGTYEGPYPGQMVMVGFENGNFQSPFVVNKYPYQGTGNSYTEASYINPLTAAGFSAQDVLVGHFSGSYLSFNTLLPLPGSVTLNAITDMQLLSNTNIQLEALISKITGLTHIELNGNTNFAVKFTEMQLAFNTLKTELNNFIAAYNTHIHITTATIGASATPGVISPTVSQAVPATADMTNAKNLKVLM